MCGFCGQMALEGKRASAETVVEMRRTLESRGPDGEGIFQQDSIALGHRRLRVIDLTDRAAQPMVDPALGLALVYNGAIYNHAELRGELEEAGYAFQSTGDTEVILKAFHAWGESCVERFDGMFAFAIWQRDKRELFLARDRLGIKPLYYSEAPEEFRFASTLPAIVAGGGIDTSIDPEALHYYMSFHAVVPAPNTILSGVRKLPPACTMTVDEHGRTVVNEYWAPSFDAVNGETERSEEAWCERVREELRAAVQRRLVADVPVGVLLSGGLDSSLVVALLREAGVTDLETFSVGFESDEIREGNEFRYSDLVSERFGTTHRKFTVDPYETIEAMGPCIRAMSEPMVSHDVIAFYLLSREVAKSVKVVQSGQGADEVFGGYHWYPPLRSSDDPVNDYASVFFDCDHEGLQKAVDDDWISRDFSREFVAGHFARPGATASVDKALRLDTTVMLVDDPVKRVDNMTMAWGLEARVPFLDHHLVEVAARVPAHLKVRDDAEDGKYILKKIARGILPDEVIDRPKGYFPVPAFERLQGPSLEMVREGLATDAARQRGIFRKEYVEALLERPTEHVTPLRGSRLWQVALLELWLQSHDL